MKIHNTETGIDEEISVEKIQKGDNALAKMAYESFKAKENAITQLSLLKEKIDHSVSKGSSSQEDDEIKEIYSKYEENSEANFYIGEYFLKVKKDSYGAFSFFEKSLNISSLFKDQIFFYVDLICLDSLDSNDEEILKFYNHFKLLIVKWIEDRLSLENLDENVKSQFFKLKLYLEKK